MLMSKIFCIKKILNRSCQNIVMLYDLYDFYVFYNFYGLMILTI